MRHLRKVYDIDRSTYTIIKDTFPRTDFLKLINTCDALLSLHRSEGFGFHLAEAMAMGKNVVATNWSRNVDFMDETNAYPVNYRLVELKENHGHMLKETTGPTPILNTPSPRFVSC